MKTLNTQLSTALITKTLKAYPQLTQSEREKFNNTLNCLAGLDGKELDTKRRQILTNQRNMLISMMKDAVTDFDYCMTAQILKLIKSLDVLK